MKWIKRYYQQLICSCLLTMTLILFVNRSLLGTTLNTWNKHVNFVANEPADRGVPQEKREGGATRGCQISNSSNESQTLALIPLMPKQPGSENKKVTFSSVTADQNPTFWFYLSYPANIKVELVLWDETNLEEPVGQERFILSQSPGITSFQLPLTETHLEIGKKYQWYFYVYCNPKDTRSPDNTVEGSLQRVELNPNLKNQLEAAQTPLEKADVYANNQIWHERLTLLAELRREQPNNPTYQAAWTNLLQSVGLKEIDQEPIIPCCMTKD